MGLNTPIISVPVHNQKRIVSMSNHGVSPLVLWYNQLGMNDVEKVGGKTPPWVK